MVTQSEPLHAEIETTSSHLIELSSIDEKEEERNELNDDGVVLVYCINETATEEVAEEERSIEEPTVNTSAFKCSICAMEFVRKKNFENHYKKYHEGESEKTSQSTSSEIRVSLQKEKSQEDLKEKLKDDPNAKHCKFCNALFLNEKSLKIHERRKNCQLNTFECSHCKKVFTDENLFDQHVKSNHGENTPKPEVSSEPAKKYKCTYENCTKSFNMLSTFRDHQRTHDQTKPYICSICGRGFSQNTNLKQHLRRHNAIKPFKCDWVNFLIL